MGPEDAWDINVIEDEAGRSSRYQAFESPLIGLSRRWDRDGQPFLSRDLVVADERLREDFELAKMAARYPPMRRRLWRLFPFWAAQKAPVLGMSAPKGIARPWPRAVQCDISLLLPS